MKILQVHNQYINRGGEDVVLDRERQLLRENGHIVERYLASNQEISSTAKKLGTLLKLPYSRGQEKKIKRTITEYKPDLVHVHNFSPIISPSVFYACKKMKVPVVMTLHNFRLICINGMLYRNHRVCELCLSSKFPLDGIKHGCYQNSKLVSIMPALSNGLHNIMGTWQNQVDRFIFLTPLARSIFQRSKLDMDYGKTTVKPNFADDMGFDLDKEDFYIYVGRLIEEKGIDLVIDAFISFGKKLFVFGEGPLLQTLKQKTASVDNIEFMGFQPPEKTRPIFKKAKALVFASQWYEGMPLVILESLSFATPVIVADLGNGGDMIEHGSTGLKFAHDSLASLISTLKGYEAVDHTEMSRNARREFERNYTASGNLEALTSIYRDAIEESKEKKGFKGG